jgi:hypothetical protein
MFPVMVEVGLTLTIDSSTEQVRNFILKDAGAFVETTEAAIESAAYGPGIYD